MAWKPGDLTICQVLREIDEVVSSDEVVAKRAGPLLILAVSMAKRMDAKLREYNANYYDEFWKGSTNE